MTPRPRTDEANSRSLRLVRHTAMNFFGQVAPMAVALVTIPLTVHGLGMETFALLSLAWSLMVYFAHFDLGIGRAITNVVARSVASDHLPDGRRLLRAALAVEVAIGAVIAAALLPLLPSALHLLGIQADLWDEAYRMLLALVVSIPFLTVGGTLRSALEGLQRFALVNAVKAVFNALLFLIPLIGMWADWSVSEIVWWMVGSRAALVLVYGTFALRALPPAEGWPSRASLRELVSYGGWVTVTNVLAPAVTFGERFIIPAVMSVGMLAYYTAPYEMISRVAVIPYSLTLAAFPRISAAHAVDDTSLWNDLVAEPLMLLQAILTPMVVFVACFSPELLSAWLGPDFAGVSAGPVRWLALAFFFNSIAYVMLAAIQGMRRPDLAAIILLAEVVVFIGLCWWWTGYAGLDGAAQSKATIFFVDAAALTWVATRLAVGRPASGLSLRRIVLPGVVATVGAVAICEMALSVEVRLGIFVLFVIAYAVSIVPLVRRTAVLEAVMAGGIRVALREILRFRSRT